MSDTEINIAVVNIAGREFKLKCPKDKVAELQQVAKYLNEKMKEVQHGDKLITIDRVAITAALNIAHELILEKQHLKSHVSDTSSVNKKFLSLERKLDQGLALES